ncbi:penicillin acylase family protein [Dactylosporangium roseum]|uniref:Penicillin acylase family protein n=1 Tax=Dactylosporangium roseum TaxID=47989 RepID=A0ABY5ZFF3_9ACTN|nr:penicillin acylase family protein [Dactylosporangium roseum]UWZ39408.1 penicillin acylase family protein [Dactylosporangium roseum]
MTAETTDPRHPDAARQARIAAVAARARARLRVPAQPEPAHDAAAAPSRPLRGRLTVDGLDGPVEIVTDGAGVPRVFAGSRADAYRAQGFLHYSERCWQMEALARTCTGRLAEIVGPAGVPSDILVHRLGFPRAVEECAAKADRDAMEIFRHYADGLRAAATLTTPTTHEHTALGVRPDVPDATAALRTAVAIMLLNGFALQNDWLLGLLRRAVTDRDCGAPDEPTSADVLSAMTTVFGRGRPAQHGGGSNAWAVVDREAGTVVLAGDPHLAATAPPAWMAMSLAWPGGEITGATIPGVPDVVLGTNRRIAWATTFAPVTTTVLTVERLLDDGRRVSRPGGARAEVVREARTVQVRGGTRVHFEVARTDRGHLLGTGSAGGTGGWDVAWHTILTAEPYHAGALAGLATAGTVGDAAEALARHRGVPQTVVVADVSGSLTRVDVGRQLDGVHAGDLHYGWRDRSRHAPVVDRHAACPAGGLVVSANDRSATGSDPAAHWDMPWRAERIEELLRVPGDPRAASVRAQLDTRSALAVTLLPVLLGAVTDDVRPTLDPAARRLLGALEAWDGHAYRDDPAPLVLAAWLRQLTGAAVGSAGPAVAPVFFDAKAWVTRWGFALVQQWVWKQSRTETGRRVLVDTFTRAVAELTESMSGAWHEWTWGDRHGVAVDGALPVGLLPAGAQWFPRRMRLPGLDDTVCRGDTGSPARGGPSFRLVVDLTRPERSVWAFPIGNSGVPSSPHATDQVDSWQAGRYHNMIADRSALQRADAQVLVLAPAGTDA